MMSDPDNEPIRRVLCLPENGPSVLDRKQVESIRKTVNVPKGKAKQSDFEDAAGRPISASGVLRG